MYIKGTKLYKIRKEHSRRSPDEFNNTNSKARKQSHTLICTYRGGRGSERKKKLKEHLMKALTKR